MEREFPAFCATETPDTRSGGPGSTMYRSGSIENEDKIYYYSEFLGRRDKIDDEDMLTLEDKNRYERDIAELKKQEIQNLELLKKLSSITHVLLKATMENESTKSNLKNQIIKIVSENNRVL